MKLSTPKRVGASKGFSAQMDDKKKLVLVLIAIVTSGGIVLLLSVLQQHALSDLMTNLSPIPSAGGPGSLYIPPEDPPNWSNFSNIYVPPGASYTDTLFTLLKLNGSIPCHNQSTNFTKLHGLPKPRKGKVSLQYNTKYSLDLVAYTEEGKRRCSGGDYFEVDLHSDNFRSRPPTVDYGNGTYGVELEVPGSWAGVFTLEVSLLFSNWHGMDQVELAINETFCVKEVMMTKELHVVLNETGVLDSVQQIPNMNRCTKEDFYRPHWSGRWTRGWFDENCKPDKEKRYRCLPPEHSSCEEPWCFGPLYRLESNGWSYSAHCSFKLFERDEAWECLNNRWIVIWGDSNFQDTIRNLLLFILDWQLPSNQNLAEFQLERKYEKFFINPYRPDQSFQVSMIFNGHHLHWDNGEGLRTLNYQEHTDWITMHFNGTKAPDTLIMNSGLHDGYHEIDAFIEEADKAVEWWLGLYKQIPDDRKPQLLWRTTVAPAGLSRSMPGNPQKMESYNHIMMEKLKAVRHEMPVKFVDSFDMTFPFHYTNEFSDGGHYGRAPGTPLKPWYRSPHWYFVDIMLAHIWLNALCPPNV
ncbi:hypothetical protein R1flu_025074 [Riccia fluitans]|uniref:Uncharacterized protein n=1 Tax=Riccia fluitans TaxID=41844 RepID=A0ABD1XWP9_9MARC